MYSPGFPFKALLLSVLFLLTVRVLVSKRTTLQVITLAGHGSAFPSTGLTLKHLPQSLKESLLARGATDRNLYGTLTANGLHMTHTLGRVLRAKFDSFLTDSVKRISDVEIVAASQQASMLSAQALALGVFGAFDQKTFSIPADYSTPQFAADAPEDSDLRTALPLGYYPFAVGQVEAQYDFLFESHTERVCPSFASLSARQNSLVDKYLAQADLIVKEQPVLQELLQEIGGAAIFGSRFIATRGDLGRLADYLWAMRALGVDFGVPQSTFETLRLLNMIVQSAFLFGKKALAVQMAQMAALVKARVDALGAGGGSPLTVLVGSHVNVWAFLQALGLSSTECIERRFNGEPVDKCFFQPPFGASLVLEVFTKEQDGPLFVGKV